MCMQQIMTEHRTKGNRNLDTLAKGTGENNETNG